MIIKKEIKSEKKIQKEDFSLYLEKGIIAYQMKY